MERTPPAEGSRRLRRPSRALAFLLALALTLTVPGAGYETAAAPPAGKTRVMIGFRDASSSSPAGVMRSAGAVGAMASISTGGGAIVRSFGIVPAVAAYLSPAEIENLRKNPSVAYVEEDHLAHTCAASAPWWVILIPVAGACLLSGCGGDSKKPDSPPPPPPPSTQTVPWGISKIGAPTVHAGANYGGGIRVAVLDTGVYPWHEDLLVAGGATFVPGTSTWHDDNGHGTHVAGTLAALNNRVGVIGAAPGVDLYSVKVLDSTGTGWISDIVAGIDWCRNNGIRVINISITTESDTETLKQACENAYAAGMVIVAAAGNSGNAAGTGDTVGYPARYSTVIAVAATTSYDLRPSFSSTGPAVELAAPGQDVHSTLRGGGYGNMNGTSMAAPHVAGVAALILRANPSYTNVDVRNALTRTAVDLGTAGRDNLYGYGLVSAPHAIRKTSAPAAVPVSTATVYITDTGSKYHRDGCRYLRQSRIPIGLEEAKAKGYTPCSVCKPPN